MRNHVPPVRREVRPQEGFGRKKQSLAFLALERLDTDRIQVVIARRLLNHYAKEGVFAVHAIDDERKTIVARYVFGVPIFMVLVLHRVGVVAVHRLEPSVEIVVLETNTVEEILVDGGGHASIIPSNG